VFCLEQWQPTSDQLHYLNVGTGSDVTIKELAEQVASAVGFDGTIVWDTSKPDGTPRKLLDVSRLRSLGWQSRIPLEQGLLSVVAEFQSKSRDGQEVRL
jgi:GDP-L-fucose synthase